MVGAATTTAPDSPASVADVLSHVAVLDVDTHIMEPVDLWTSRMRSSWGDGIPHIAVDDHGNPGWYTGGEKIMGWSIADSHPYLDDETWAGGNDPAARLRWMDLHGVHAQALYPNLIGFFASTLLRADPQLRLEIYQAYNDYQAEFCAAAPDRLIALANLPFWDLDAAIRELHRCIQLGHKGVNFGWRFEQMGLPRLRDDHWEPLLKAIEETGLSVNLHIGFNGNADDDPALRFDAATEGLDRAKNAAMLFLGNAACIAELIMGRICHRYPTLKFVSVESGIGYVPYVLDALEWTFLNENWHKVYTDMLLPSEYFRRQIYATFWFEPRVNRVADLYPDNFMFSSDYPHPTSLTPTPKIEVVRGPRDTLLDHLQGLSHDVIRKVVHDNAARVYGLHTANA